MIKESTIGEDVWEKTHSTTNQLIEVKTCAVVCMDLRTVVDAAFRNCYWNMTDATKHIQRNVS